MLPRPRLSGPTQSEGLPFLQASAANLLWGCLAQQEGSCAEHCGRRPGGRRVALDDSGCQRPAARASRRLRGWAQRQVPAQMGAAGQQALALPAACCLLPVGPALCPPPSESLQRRGARPRPTWGLTLGLVSAQGGAAGRKHSELLPASFGRRKSEEADALAQGEKLALDWPSGGTWFRSSVGRCFCCSVGRCCCCSVGRCCCCRHCHPPCLWQQRAAP